MKIQMETKLNRPLALGAALAAVTCAAAALLAKVQWLSLACCALSALTLLLTGSGAIIVQVVIAVAYAAAEWLLAGAIPWAAAALCAGMLAARGILAAGGRQVTELEKKLTHEQLRRDSASLVSELGQARNLRAYQNDAAIYLKLTSRYHLTLSLFFWRLENAQSIHRQLGDDAFADLVSRISATMNANMRAEDMLYLLSESDEDLRWGSLHISNDAIVQEVVRERVLKAFSAITLGKGLRLNFKVVNEIAAPNMTPMSLLDAVTKKLGE